MAGLHIRQAAGGKGMQNAGKEENTERDRERDRDRDRDRGGW